MGGSRGILDVGWEIRGGAHSGRLCQDVVTILTDGSAFPAWLDGVAFVSRGTAVGKMLSHPSQDILSPT